MTWSPSGSVVSSTHSSEANTLGRIGEPRTPGRQSTPSNLFSAGRANRCEYSTCSTARILTAKCFTSLKAAELREMCAIDHSTRGGSIDSDEKEFAVTPTGSPFATVVITPTPVENCPRQRLKAFESAAGSPSSTASLRNGSTTWCTPSSKTRHCNATHYATGAPQKTRGLSDTIRAISFSVKGEDVDYAAPPRQALFLQLATCRW